MESNNIYFQCKDSRNGPCDQGKHGEKDTCKIGILEETLMNIIKILKLIYSNFQSFI